MSVSRIRARVGDVFQLPIDEERVGYGQVVLKRRSSCYFIAFRSVYPPAQPPDVEAIVKDVVELAMEGDDVCLELGRWRIVGNREPDRSLALPLYTVHNYSADRWEVGTFDGRRRAATSEELERLPGNASFSSTTLENALRARHGAGKWYDGYEELAYGRFFAVRDIVF
jgi:hypothetical protein